MDLCVMVEGQEGVTWPQWQAIAAACELHDVPALFRSDHYCPLDAGGPTPVLDAWATTCALAVTTTTLRIGVLVSPATFRHPAVLAKLAATADHMSGGRIDVGVGACWHAREHHTFGFPFPPTSRRIDILAEQLQILRGLWSGEAFSFAGEHYEVMGATAHPTPIQDPMPLIVGGSAGPRSAAMAAAAAAEYNTAFVTAECVRERRAVLARAWVAAGRDPATLRLSVMTGLAIGQDRAEGPGAEAADCRASRP